MSKDLANIYDGWDFQPNQPVVRKIMGDDGRPKIQLRLDLGILQMEMTGRPDGKRPYGKESLLDHYESLLAEYIARQGSDEGFHLTMEDFARLHQEGIQYYHRYISLFQLQEYEAVVRDTERNLRLLDFVAKYTEPPEMAQALTQFRPYILMMNARAKAIISRNQKDYARAISQLETGAQNIRDYYETTQHPELIEVSPELKILESTLNEIRAARPLSRREMLEKALQEAVEKENYEQAAMLRDQLKKLSQPAHATDDRQNVE